VIYVSFLRLAVSTAFDSSRMLFRIGDEIHMDMGAPPCSSSSRDHLTVFEVDSVHRDKKGGSLLRAQRDTQSSSTPRASAPRSFRDFDWSGADVSEQPVRKRKYVTKKTLEHNDAAAVLSLAPLIQVIGSSLDLEEEGEGELPEALDGGTSSSSDDVEKEWGVEAEGDEEVSSTSTESAADAEGDGTSSSALPVSTPVLQIPRVPGLGAPERVGAGSVGGDTISQVSPETIAFVPCTGSDKSGEENIEFFRAELLLTMRTPLSHLYKLSTHVYVRLHTSAVHYYTEGIAYKGSSRHLETNPRTC
jgi:hypothetical protein